MSNTLGQERESTDFIGSACLDLLLVGKAWHPNCLNINDNPLLLKTTPQLIIRNILDIGILFQSNVYRICTCLSDRVELVLKSHSA